MARLRTNFRGEDVHVYRLDVAPAKARVLLLRYLDELAYDIGAIDRSSVRVSADREQPDRRIVHAILPRTGGRTPEPATLDGPARRPPS